MKKLFYLLFLCSFLSLSAQQTQEVYPKPKYPELFRSLSAPIAENDPKWVKEMYSKNPNFLKLQKLYQQYYDTHKFQKTTHTQNYKHFCRIIRQNGYYDEKGNVVVKKQVPTRASFVKQQSIFKAPSTNPEWQPVAPLETFDANGKTISRHVNVFSIAQSQSNPNILYCGTETGAVFKSTDQGNNWQETGKYVFGGQSAQAIKIDPKDENVVYVAYDKKFYRTTDGGQNWTLLLEDANWKMDVEVHPTQDIVYLGGAGGLLRSTDKGATWTTIIAPGANGDGRISDIEFKSDDPSTVFVAKANATVNRFEIWKSTDNGLTFQPKTNGWYQPTNSNRDYNMGIGGAQGAKIANTKADPNRLYVLLLGSDVSYTEDLNFIGIFRTDNAGESWTMPYDGNNDGQPDNNYGGPYSNQHWCLSSDPVTGTWHYDQGFYNADIDVSDTNPDLFLVGMLNLFRSEDGGKSYKKYGGYNCQDCPNDGRFRHPDIQDILVQDGYCWIANDGGVDKYSSNLVFVDSKNKGISTCDMWGFDQGWNDDVLVGGRYHDGDMAYYDGYGNGKTLALGGGERRTGHVNLGDNRKVYHSDIGGKLIPTTIPGTVSSIPDLQKYPTTKAVPRTSEIINDPRYWNDIFLGKENKLWKSDDYGQTFELVKEFGNSADIWALEISRNDPKIMFVVQFEGGAKIYRTTDGGANWTSLTLPVTNKWLNISLNEKDELYVAFDAVWGNNKIYKSTDLGNNWENITGSNGVLNGQKIIDIEIQGGTDGGVYAIGSKNVFYRNNTMDWVDYSDGLPESFRLLNGKIFYKKGKLRLAGNRGVWERDLYEPSTPVAQPMANKKEVFCPTDKVQFEDYSMLNHTNATWHWEFEGANWVSDPNARNPKASFGTPGEHKVTLTVTNDQGTHTKTVEKMIKVADNDCQPAKYAGDAGTTGNEGYFKTTFDEIKKVTHFTFTGWVKPNGIQTDFSSIIYLSGGNVISLDFKNGKNELGTHCGDKWGVNSGLIVPKDRWSYVGLIYTPNKVTLILNEKTYEINGTFGPVLIRYLDVAIHNNRQDRKFKGQFDELRFWDRALHIDDIRLIRHLTTLKNNQKNGLFAYYQFDEFTNGKINNKVGLYPLAKYSDGDLLESTAPVGPGVSELRTLLWNNTYVAFNAPKVVVHAKKAFNGSGHVIATRLNVDPFFKPTAYQNLNEEYYFIENYGGGAAVGDLKKIEFNDIQNTTGSENSDIVLYQRERNSDVESEWVEKGTAALLNGTKVEYEPINIDINIPYNNESSNNTLLQTSGQFYIKTKKEVITETKGTHTSQILVYPNPANAKEGFCFKGITENSNLKVYNQLGKLVYVGLVSENQYINSITEKGVYLYMIQTETKIKTGKLIVK